MIADSTNLTNPHRDPQIAAAYGAHAVAIAEYHLAAKAEQKAASRAVGWCRRGAGANGSEAYRDRRAAAAATGRAYDEAMRTMYSVQAAQDTAEAGENAAVRAALRADRLPAPGRTCSSVGSILLVQAPSVIGEFHVACNVDALGGDLHAADKSRRDYVYEASYSDEDGGGPCTFRHRSLRRALLEIQRDAQGRPCTVNRVPAKEYDDPETTAPDWQTVCALNGADWRIPFA